jgi:NAD(P)-dependent dehydrogenase (short-subunit alcohol dehydrogenase family)
VTVEGFELTGKRALVVGAGSAVGRSIVRALAEAGARVALGSVQGSSEELGRLREVAGGLGVALGAADLTLPGAADRMVRQALEALGGLDVVVSCGDLRLAGPFTTLTDAEWDRLVAVNLTAPVRLLRAAGRELLARAGGRVICVVSMLGERGLPYTAAYGACQAGLMQLVRALSLEWARRNVRVNAIALGWLESDPFLGEETAAALVKYLPARRLGLPGEVGPLAVYLASDAADMMTGQTIFVDGAAMAHA